MQKKYEKPVSFDEVLEELKEGKMEDKKTNLMKLAGKWVTERQKNFSKQERRVKPNRINPLFFEILNTR